MLSTPVSLLLLAAALANKVDAVRERVPAGGVGDRP